MNDKVWTVDKFIDSLKERPRERVENEGVWLAYDVFDSRDAAISFMLQRAQQQLSDACKKVKTLQTRVIKLRKKYL